MRMLLVGYIMGIRSERRLCEEVHLNLAYRWFCRLDLTDLIPDHSTFSKNRHGRCRDSDLLGHLFETVVTQCIDEGLASGQCLAAEASIIQADANRQNPTPKSDWQPDRIDPKKRLGLSGNIWIRSMMLPSVGPARSSQSLPLIPIWARNGLELGEAQPILPTPPTN